MNREIERDFKNPGSWYRGSPFWAWNGALEPEELRRQIRLMKKMGMGGFFMHSRVGLATPYLGKEWFRCIEACVEEAEKLGMLAWLYDEDRWPSGAAGGLVTRDPRYRKRSLMMERLEKPGDLRWTSEVVAAFTTRVDGTTATEVTQIPARSRLKVLPAGHCILVFRVLIDPTSPWYNGATYLDTLNPQAVRRFIAVTHQAYRARFSRRFGKVIPGIFTDEPNFGHKLAENAGNEERRGLPWTGGLPGAFKKRYGYDLTPHLVELFLDKDGAEMTPARWHYHDMVTQLFVDSFARQIGEWCRQNRMIHIGHVLAEDTLSQQTNVTGSPMRFYEHMQAPGMDLLTERWRAYTTAKQVSSAARQFGKKWRLTETYGCTGWDFPFVGHKALGDWQAALGINFRCQHLVWYTMESEAKRDYPASISAQSPWWDAYPVVEDYFARILAVMSRGEEIRDILVIHPVESMWVMVRQGWTKDAGVKEYDRMLVDLENGLLCAHLDFDFGDEDILSRHSAVSKAGSSKPILKVGKAQYAAVVVPPLRTMRSTTLDLLEKFARAGGLVVFAGEPPGFMNAVASEVPRTLASSCVRAPAKGPALSKALERAGRRVSISEPGGQEIASALYLLREDKEAFYLFVCNTGLGEAELERDMFDMPRVIDRTLSFAEVRIRGFADCKARPVELDPRSGAMHLAEAARDSSGQWVIRTSLPPVGSRLFVVSKRKETPALEPHPALSDARRVSFEDGRWDILRTEDNVLVLDAPSFRIGDGELQLPPQGRQPRSQERWREPMEILRVDQEVRRSLGVAPRGAKMVQPWARLRARNPKKTSVELRYQIVVDSLLRRALRLAVERPEIYSISVNGQEITSDSQSGWWIDPSLRTLPIDPCLLHLGANEIRLACQCDEEHPGLETVYLLGDFGVDLREGNPRVVDAPQSLALGDWCPQGLPFYSGSVCYRRTATLDRANGERLFLLLPEYRGVAARVRVNGKTAGIICWEPNEVEITDCVPIGQSASEILIEILGHRRNSHGPLHHAQKWPVWTGPAQFITEGSEWSDGYQLVPCGMTKAPAIVARRVS